MLIEHTYEAVLLHTISRQLSNMPGRKKEIKKESKKERKKERPEVLKENEHEAVLLENRALLKE